MRLLTFLTGTALAVTMVPGLSAAQTAPAGTPMFRVPLSNDSGAVPVNPVYVWEESVGSCSTSCGTGTRTTSYVCQNASDFDFGSSSYGAPEPDGQCTASIGAPPLAQTEACTVYSGCGFDWVTPAPIVTPTPIAPNPVGRVGCGQIHEAFSPYCRRADGTVLSSSDHAFCAGDRPDYDQVAAGNPDALGYDRLVIQTAQCNTTDHDWVLGTWSGWSSECSTTSSRTRSVQCVRRFDGTLAADSACAGPKPAASETQARYGSCSYSWQASAWGAWNSTCSTNAQRTRTATCIRSNGDAVADTECTGRGIAKPSLVETGPQYGSCTYTYEASAWGAWSSDCSATATRTRSLTCKRSNGDVVPNTECSSRGVVAPATSETQARYGSCSYAWETGAWSGYSSTCSAAATRTRSVICKRSSGDVVADTECSSRVGTKPATSETSAQYGSCSYAWNVGAWGAFNSTCSASATRTRPVTCSRSDGTTVADAECSSRVGAKPATSETSAQYGSCGYSWTVGAWGAYNSTCSASATRTRPVSCARSDGTTVADTECSSRVGAKPATSETSAQYGSCGYGFQTGGWSAWSSSCSSSAARTRAVWCQRTDGTTVADTECTGRGQSRPSDTEWSAQTSGCSYSAGYSSWSSCTGGTQSRAVTCTRSDGIVVDPSFCGVAATETQSCSVALDANACKSMANSVWKDVPLKIIKPSTNQVSGPYTPSANFPAEWSAATASMWVPPMSTSGICTILFNWSGKSVNCNYRLDPSGTWMGPGNEGSIGMCTQTN